MGSWINYFSLLWVEPRASVAECNRVVLAELKEIVVVNINEIISIKIKSNINSFAHFLKTRPSWKYCTGFALSTHEAFLAECSAIMDKKVLSVKYVPIISSQCYFECRFGPIPESNPSGQQTQMLVLLKCNSPAKELHSILNVAISKEGWT